MTTTTPSPRFKTDLVRRLALTLLVVGSLVGLVFVGKAAVTGGDQASGAKPTFVERFIPDSGGEVLRQATVGIDLADGYTGYLVINGVEVRTPEDGLRSAGNGLYTVTPGVDPPGGKAKIASLNTERNTVLAFVWRTSEGEKTAQAVSWSFTAA